MIENVTFRDYADCLAQPPPPTKWIIENLVAEGENLLIGGTTGIGKSLLRTQLALAFIQGESFLDYACCQAPVLIIQHENSSDAEWRRVYAMAPGLRIGKGIMLGFDSTFDLPKDAGQLQAIVERSNARIIIYDCLATLHGSDENNNSEMRRVCECLKKVDRNSNTTSVVIHHFRKPKKDEDGTDIANLRGASAITDYAGNVMVLSRDSTEFKVSIVKTRDSEEAGRELYCTRNSDTLKLEILDEVARGMAYDLPAVQMLLEDGPIVTQTAFIKELTEKSVADSPKQARKMIEMAVSQGLIYKFGLKGGKKTYSLETEYAAACRQASGEE